MPVDGELCAGDGRSACERGDVVLSWGVLAHLAANLPEHHQNLQHTAPRPARPTAHYFAACTSWKPQTPDETKFLTMTVCASDFFAIDAETEPR